jgi:hypothetical protein
MHGLLCPDVYIDEQIQAERKEIRSLLGPGSNEQNEMVCHHDSVRSDNQAMEKNL